MVLFSGIMGRKHGESSHVLVCLATDKQSSYSSSQTAAGAEAVLFTVRFLSCMGVTLDVVGHTY